MPSLSRTSRLEAEYTAGHKGPVEAASAPLPFSPEPRHRHLSPAGLSHPQRLQKPAACFCRPLPKQATLRVAGWAREDRLTANMATLHSKARHC